MEIPGDTSIRVEEFLGRYVGVRASKSRLQPDSIDPVPIYVADELVPLERRRRRRPRAARVDGGPRASAGNPPWWRSRKDMANMVRFHRLSRRLAGLLAAGTLLQAGSCAFDTRELGAQLVTSVVNNFIASYVFGAFNLVGP